MNDELNSDAPKFDLFATEVEDNLKEELAKGTFQWTNKYTKVLGIAFVIVGLLSVGTWYGHYEATKSTSTSAAAGFASLRAAFGGGAGLGTGTGAAAAAGGFGGFGGGGTRITGTIKSVKGSTVTITLDDPTQASSLVSGDAARVTDTGGAAAGAAPAPVSPVAPAGQTPPSGAPTAPGTAPAIGGGGGGGGGGRGGGGLFSNPALVTCLSKAGVTITPGQRPNFQDPATQTALAACMSQLGIAAPGRIGAGAPNPTATP